VPGQTLVIRPGERVPIDGIVKEGRSFVDQSVITGESIPVSKSPGDHVYAGSINTRGSLHINATSRHEDTALARIVHLVEEAQLKRAPVQTLVERFARIYTPTILALAVVVAILPPLVLDASFGTWFYRALVLLVIACPCALVISTPVTIVSALTKGARLGILIKGGRQIETLSKIRAMAFDKTGTLTLGQPRVTDIVPLNSLPRERLLQIIAALEHRSEHPLASAVLTQAVHDAVGYDQLQVESFEALPGLGVRATIDGEEYFLGNHQLCEDRGFCSPEVERILQALESDGKTAIVLGRERQALCILAVRDMARIQSKSAINRLRDLGVHRVTLLSGDHETSARQLAEEVGIPEYQAGLLPQRKIEVVQEMKRQHGVVAMVGDGINDAPALAAASVGIAMGVNGSDAVLETADVVLMGDDLSKLPTLIGLSRKAMSIVKQNILIALSMKLLFLILSIGGVASLWMAVLADDGAALVVILNGLRVLSFKEDL
ncbi:MAG: heavy metal translocating P-type ATPase, partial [Bacteroidota bacterium]